MRACFFLAITGCVFFLLGSEKNRSGNKMALPCWRLIANHRIESIIGLERPIEGIFGLRRPMGFSMEAAVVIDEGTFQLEEPKAELLGTNFGTFDNIGVYVKLWNSTRGRIRDLPVGAALPPLDYPVEVDTFLEIHRPTLVKQTLTIPWTIYHKNNQVFRFEPAKPINVTPELKLASERVIEDDTSFRRLLEQFRPRASNHCKVAKCQTVIEFLGPSEYKAALVVNGAPVTSKRMTLQEGEARNLFDSNPRHPSGFQTNLLWTNHARKVKP